MADGGPGRCFPGGHASGAFAFVGGWFALREHRPTRARAWLIGSLLLGASFSTAQTLRGAHYPSHGLYSAWICWCVCATASALARGPLPGHRLRVPSARAADRTARGNAGL
ncbi:phosphatase PAP2 family protein [Rivibacter subsaxonicus]|uniref:phosphatase PAP2 family protein n=1 Tax=Rivibacter subsaxonicus TaxID=457575 RepID=UPI0030FEB461